MRQFHSHIQTYHLHYNIAISGCFSCSKSSRNCLIKRPCSRSPAIVSFVIRYLVVGVAAVVLGWLSWFPFLLGKRSFCCRCWWFSKSGGKEVEEKVAAIAWVQSIEVGLIQSGLVVSFLKSFFSRPNAVKSFLRFYTNLSTGNTILHLLKQKPYVSASVSAYILLHDHFQRSLT